MIGKNQSGHNPATKRETSANGKRTDHASFAVAADTIIEFERTGPLSYEIKRHRRILQLARYGADLDRKIINHEAVDTGHAREHDANPIAPTNHYRRSTLSIYLEPEIARSDIENNIRGLLLRNLRFFNHHTISRLHSVVLGFRFIT